MNKAYENMRGFWLDVKNLENRKGIMELGADKISIAGVEMPVADGQNVKYLLIATNSLGDSSLYFENNSKSGLGGMIGGHGNEKLQEIAAHMLAHASKLTGQMEKSAQLPAAEPGNITLFAVFIKNCPKHKRATRKTRFIPCLRIRSSWWGPSAPKRRRTRAVARGKNEITGN